MTTTREEAIELISTEFDWDEIADPVREHFIRLIDLARAKGKAEENEAIIDMLQHAGGEMVLVQDVIGAIRARMKP